jgi:hypothetical protein
VTPGRKETLVTLVAAAALLALAALAPRGPTAPEPAPAVEVAPAPASEGGEAAPDAQPDAPSSPRLAPPAAGKENASAAVPVVPLDRLLTLRRTAPSDLRLGADGETTSPPRAAPLRPGAGDFLRLGHRSQDLGPAGPRDTRLGQTDLSVGVPLDDAKSVRVRGGVRVDTRVESDKGVTDVDTAPTVGVEVHF